MPATNNELEVLIARARRESIALERLQDGGATTNGQVLQWTGTKWAPGIILNADGTILDLDGTPIGDLDGEGVYEPGEGEFGALEVRVVKYVQGTPSAFWTINHGIGRYPISTELRGTNGRQLFATWKFPSLFTATVKFAGPRAGEAILTFYLQD